MTIKINYLFGCYVSLFLLSALVQSCNKIDVKPEQFLTSGVNKGLSDRIKTTFYQEKLDEKLKPNIKEDLHWSPDWDHPSYQEVNDSTSYICHQLRGFVRINGKNYAAKEVDAATYLMVKNGKQFIKASYRSTVKAVGKARYNLDFKKFTGKLIISDLGKDENFLFYYDGGRIAERTPNQQSASKTKSYSSQVKGWQRECHDEMRECTYVLSGTPSCSIEPYADIEIVYSESCTQPSSVCGTTYWLSDFTVKTVCENVWFPDPPNTPGGSNGNGGTTDNSGHQPSEEDPGDAYEVTNNEDKLDLDKRFECFAGVPDNANTVYSAKLCADLPNNDNPSELFNFSKLAPGHAFITLTKRNGSHAVTETIGFYPESGTKSVFGNYVESQINDDGVNRREREYNASLDMIVNRNDFDAMLNLAKNLAGQKYNLKDFNCTDYAIAVFNEGRPLNNKIEVPDWIIYRNNESINYGTTPNGLYAQIRWKKLMENDPNASINIGKAKTSTKCN